MVLLWIGIAVGILILTILIVKISKTNPHEVLGVSTKCSTCGLETHGLKCPKCKKNKPSFGV